MKQVLFTVLLITSAMALDAPILELRWQIDDDLSETLNEIAKGSSSHSLPNQLEGLAHHFIAQSITGISFNKQTPFVLNNAVARIKNKTDKSFLPFKRRAYLRALGLFALETIEKLAPEDVNKKHAQTILEQYKHLKESLWLGCFSLRPVISIILKKLRQECKD